MIGQIYMFLLKIRTTKLENGIKSSYLEALLTFFIFIVLLNF